MKWAVFLKMYIFDVPTFFFRSHLSSQLIFLPSTVDIMTENVSFSCFPWQPLLKKPIFSPQLCRLSVQTVPVKIGVKQIDYSRKSVAKVYLLPYYE